MVAPAWAGPLTPGTTPTPPALPPGVSPETRGNSRRPVLTPERRGGVQARAIVEAPTPLFPPGVSPEPSAQGMEAVVTTTTNAAPTTTQVVPAAPTVAAPTTPVPPGVSQAAIFAREHAKGAAQKMLGALDEIGRNAAKITWIALGVSMPHQISFLLGLILPTLHVDGSLGWTYAAKDIIHLLGMFLLVAGVPVAADLLIVSCIKVIGQAAASRGSKIGAMYIMAMPVLASVTVNVLAPAPHPILRVLAGFIVAVIPASEILRFLVRPDFAKIEQMEIAVEERLTRRIEDVVTAPAATPTVDHKALNRERMKAAERARDLALQNPKMTVAALARAAGCGHGAAKKALAKANEAQPVDLEVVEV